MVDPQQAGFRRGRSTVDQATQGSVLSPILLNISDLPETSSRKYGYADNLAILLRHPSWKQREEGLNKDMTIPVEYLQNLRPQLSVGMKMWAAYHLKNREAKRELNAFVDNKHLVFQQDALCTLACVSAKTLRISTRTLVFSVGEYRAPAWNRRPHVKKVGSILLTISGCRKAISLTRDYPHPCRSKGERSHPRPSKESRER